MISRRTLLKRGLVGGALLAGGGLAATALWRDPVRDRDDVIRAVIPALLAGALPDGGEAARAIDRCHRDVVRAIAGLSPATQRELAQLFALMSVPATRIALTGLSQPWAQAEADEVAAFLQRWRIHRVALLRSAYLALHDLVLGTWYADPSSWPLLGYPGPAEIAA